MIFQLFSLFLLIPIALGGTGYHPRKTKEDVDQQRSGLDPLGITLDNFSEIWTKRSQEYIESRLKYQTNNGKAKNVIMFLGDGLSMVTTAATRMYLGGEEVELSYEQFPHLGFVKTYCVDRQVADSACTGEMVIFEGSFLGVMT
jgi:alkaline phosphatase